MRYWCNNSHARFKVVISYLLRWSRLVLRRFSLQRVSATVACDKTAERNRSNNSTSCDLILRDHCADLRQDQSSPDLDDVQNSTGTSLSFLDLVSDKIFTKIRSVIFTWGCWQTDRQINKQTNKHRVKITSLAVVISLYTEYIKLHICSTSIICLELKLQSRK